MNNEELIKILKEEESQLNELHSKSHLMESYAEKLLLEQEKVRVLEEKLDLMGIDVEETYFLWMKEPFFSTYFRYTLKKELKDER